MALNASRCRMSAGEWKRRGAVIEVGSCKPDSAMAESTIVIEVIRYVIRIGHACEIRLVTGIASSWCA